MKDRKIFNRILNNNKAVAVLSVIIAALIWLFVSVELVPETTSVISDVAVNVNSESVEALGLTAYGLSDTKVNVTVRGKSYIVDSKNIKDSISVTADTSSVVDYGNYTLRLEASAKETRPDFEIVSVEPSTVTAYFDTAVTDKEFIIEPETVSEGDIVPEGYVAGKALIDSSSAKVKVSGPLNEVSKIEKIVAAVSIDAPLTQTASVTVDFTAVTSDNSNLKYVTFDRDTQVTVKIPVYKEATLRSAVDYLNRPSDYIGNIDFPVTVTPSQLQVGISESKLESVEEIVVKNIDFSELNVGANTFTVTAAEIEKLNSCLILDGTSTVTVNVYVENLESKEFAVPSEIKPLSEREDLSIGSIIPDFETVTVIGTEETLETLAAEGITLYADISKIEEGASGFVTVPVVLSGNDSYWLYGDGYTANVEIKAE